MSCCRYRIVVDGELDDVTAAGFPEVELERSEGCTCLFTLPVDQAGLGGLLDRLRHVGLELVSLDRLEPITPR